VDAWVKAHPVAAVDAWERAMPAAAYQFADQAPGEPAEDAVFPHLLVPPIRTGRGTPGFINLWDETPLADAYVAAMARGLVERLRLGQGEGTDALAISFSGLDFVGHRFGPRSHEVQDTLYRLDALLEELFADLDRLVGRGRYTVAFSADHGVSFLPEQGTPVGAAGRVSAAAVGRAVEAALDQALGSGRYVDAVAAGALYFSPDMLPRIRARSEVMDLAATAARGVPGIAGVYWSADLASRTPTSDSLLQAFRRSYVAGRSGDLVYVTAPNWIPTATGVTHGSPYDYDTRVPLVFYGAGIKAGTYPGLASPADIAPTLAAIAGVTMARLDGAARREAMTR
jgi:predicted AlkP superfamily pyrophosphatase or phosphodiesterase